jgi:mannitol/fructose-specific phosphotransferase system IIA component (Ntr-type)
MRLSEIISDTAIVQDVMATHRDAVIQELVDALEAAGQVKEDDRERLLMNLLKREAVASTALGNGVAIPHAKVPFVSDFCGALGISNQGCDFGAPDRRRVNVIFLFLSPEHAISGHLQLMAHIAGIARNQKYLRLLREARSMREIKQLLAQAESMLFSDPGDTL